MFERVVEAIRVAIETAAISQTAMAKQLGFSQASLSRILNGEQQMGHLVAHKVLNVHPEWVDLLHGNGNGNNGTEPPCSNN